MTFKRKINFISQLKQSCSSLFLFLKDYLFNEKFKDCLNSFFSIKKKRQRNFHLFWKKSQTVFLNPILNQIHTKVYWLSRPLSSASSTFSFWLRPKKGFSFFFEPLFSNFSTQRKVRELQGLLLLLDAREERTNIFLVLWPVPTSIVV